MYSGDWMGGFSTIFKAFELLFIAETTSIQDRIGWDPGVKDGNFVTACDYLGYLWEIVTNLDWVNIFTHVVR